MGFDLWYKYIEDFVLIDWFWIYFLIWIFGFGLLVWILVQMDYLIWCGIIFTIVKVGWFSMVYRWCWFSLICSSTWWRMKQGEWGKKRKVKVDIRGGSAATFPSEREIIGAKIMDVFLWLWCIGFRARRRRGVSGTHLI